MTRRVSHIFFLLAVGIIWSPFSFGQSLDCFESATVTKEMDRCGEAVIFPLENKVSTEFARLEQKYGANNEIPEILRLVKDNWNGYRNFQCILEGVAAVGGRTEKRRSIEAQRAFMKCVARTLNEMYAAISKL